MSAGAIGGLSASGSSSNAFSNIKSEDFIKILISELANQDPLDPQDSSALLEQLSSLRNIESQLSLQDQLEGLVNQNQLAMAGGMIGKLVSGRDSFNSEVSGIVTAIRVEDGKAILELDSARTLPIANVLRITDLESDAGV